EPELLAEPIRRRCHAMPRADHGRHPREARRDGTASCRRLVVTVNDVRTRLTEGPDEPSNERRAAGTTVHDDTNAVVSKDRSQWATGHQAVHFDDMARFTLEPAERGDDRLR